MVIGAVNDKIEALPYKPALGLVLATLIVVFAIYRLQQVDSVYSGFVQVGKQKSAWTVKAAKEIYIREGRHWLLEYAQKRVCYVIYEVSIMMLQLIVYL